MRKTKSIDMTSGPIMGPLVRFILPLIGSSIFQQLYNTVDFLFVGNFLTKTSAAAVGASATLISCTIGLFSGISVGTSVIAAQAIGRKDMERGEKALHSSVTFGIVGGLLIMALGMLFSPNILTLLRTPKEVMPEAVRYIRIYLLSIPMVVFYNMVSGGLRASGDSKTPFMVLVICGLLNVLLDAVFIVWIPMGVAGVAIATTITQTLSAVLIGIKAAAPEQALRLSFKKLGVDWPILGDVLRIGLPTGVQTIIITFSNVMVQYYINDFGETAVAAFASYYKVENLIYLPIMAFGQASTTFSGQNTGAGNFRRIRKGTALTVLMGCIVVGCISGAILAFPRTVFTWFMKDQSVVDVALKIALVSFPFYWIYPILEISGGAVRGMGYSIRSMIIIIANLCVLRVALLAVFSKTIHTIRALASVYPITWAAAALSFVITFMLIITKKIKENERHTAA
ncbi:MAG: MATE family efflux transporter [Oscillospiraceae bacterium]|nr:MATE family efflux transporter [Oscillospiraceae bacterium]